MAAYSRRLPTGASGAATAALACLAALALLAMLPSLAAAQLTDDARTSTEGTQFVKPPPKPPPPPKPEPKPPPPPPKPVPAPPRAKAEPPPKAPPKPPARWPSVVFLVDTSDSMLNRLEAGADRTRLDEAKTALERVLKDMAPITRVQVWTFNTRMKPVPVSGVRPGQFVRIGAGTHRDQLVAAVRKLRTAGGTNLYQSVVNALALFAAPADQAAYRSGQRFPVLVVVSDGEDGGKTPETLRDVQQAKARLPLVTVNTIGFRLGDGSKWLQVLCEIATAPKGCATADDEAQLRRMLNSFYRYRAGR